MILAEAQTVVVGLINEIRLYMLENNTDVLIGNEHKARYKDVIQIRLDGKALKEKQPDIYKAFTTCTKYKRFKFD
ncbi:hypothetical protein SAMN05216249_1112 [Acetitomaculum ruminis DSM 5522]|uniref:Uncharacterized protein n=1 Tax=Acetitomaculum ruminis DSM 5522 TaxID=1120918 RepID=A0A1I0YPM8_9FIRM|nr:hypothetical protein [Acetitomaculum ruminis]SFB15339.1 hypothetical protein SAMN05216249_1112 [Acetitomaculum ruminis DSM 5522]